VKETHVWIIFDILLFGYVLGVFFVLVGFPARTQSTYDTNTGWTTTKLFVFSTLIRDAIDYDMADATLQMYASLINFGTGLILSLPAIIIVIFVAKWKSAHAVTPRNENMKYSNMLSFVIGFFVTILVGSLMFILSLNETNIYSPWNYLASGIMFGLAIAVPIVIGKLLKSKTSWYWTGMFCGFWFLFFIGLIYAFQGIGTNPEISLQFI